MYYLNYFIQTYHFNLFENVYHQKFATPQNLPPWVAARPALLNPPLNYIALGNAILYFIITY